MSFYYLRPISPVNALVWSSPFCGRSSRQAFDSKVGLGLMAGNQLHASLSGNTDVNALLNSLFLEANDFHKTNMLSAEAVTGLTSIPLGAILDSFDVDVKVKAPRSMGAWLKSRETGEILVSPLKRVSGRIHDRLLVLEERRISNTVRTAFWRENMVGTGTFCDFASGRLELMTWPSFLGAGGVNSATATTDTPWGSYTFALSEVTKSNSYFSIHGRPSIDGLDHLPFPQALHNAALAELEGGVFDLLTELGEAKETITYLYSILRRLISIFIGVRSKEALARKQFTGKDLVEEIASLWMQFRYAISPLVYSFEDALKALELADRQYVTVRKRLDEPFSHTVDGYTFTGVVENRVWMKSLVTSQTNVLGMNPLKTMWELTPLSFVVDWVIPVGNWLGSLVPNPSLDGGKATWSQRIRKLSITGPTGDKIQNDISYYNSWEVPLSTKFVLNFDVNMTWKRWIDSMALSWLLFIKPILR